MASELIVQTLKGPTSGANANKVIIPSGQTLDIDAWTPPAGTVLQVVSSTLVTSVTLSSANTWTDIGLSVAITPSSTSSKILVITTVDTSAAGGDVITRLLRDSTVIGAGTSGSTYNGIAGQPSGTYSNMKVSASANYLDSPNTTSALTYKIQCVGNSANNGYVNRRSQNDFGGASYITLMEIAG